MKKLKNKFLTNEPYTYDDMIKSFECEICLEFIESRSEGRLYYLFRDENKFGLLVLSSGHCAVCDPLQYHKTYKAMRLYQHQLWARVKWFTKEECIKYLESDVTELHHWTNENGTEFRTSVIDYLKQKRFGKLILRKKELKEMIK